MRPEPFHPFSLLHLVTVAIVLSVIVSAVWWGRTRELASAKKAGRVLGVVLVVYYGVEGYVRVAYMGIPPVLLLPCEICNALFFIGAFAFFTEQKIAYEILFFWTFAGTVHALITPTPLEGWPSLEYVRYFFAHGLLILSAAYAVLALDRLMTWGSLLRAAIAIQVFELLVAIVDLALDQNFMYLRHKPPSPTLIDALGPWPLYLVSLELVGIASFALWLGILSLARRVIPVRSVSADRGASALDRSAAA